MRQFRNTTVFINATDVASASLPQSTLATPWYVPPPQVDAISGVGRIPSDDSLFEDRVESYLDRIASYQVGQVLFTSLPTSFPVVISRMTDADKKRLGETNAETSTSADTLFINRIGYNGHIKIIFPDPLDYDGGPATSPHEKLMHELTHAFDMGTHGGYADDRKMTGKVVGYNVPELFDDFAEFFAILITNIMISEYGTQLRLHHHGHAVIPSSIGDSKSYYKAFEKPIEGLWDRNRIFMYRLANLKMPKFNPLSYHFLTEEDFP